MRRGCHETRHFIFSPDMWCASFRCEGTPLSFLRQVVGLGFKAARKRGNDMGKVKNGDLWYVYTYRDPNSGLPFYIGKGEDLRAFSHVRGDGSQETNSRIESIRATGREPVIEIVARSLSEEMAYAIEMALIEFVGKENLTNKQRGVGYRDHGKINADRLGAYLVGECVTLNDFKGIPTIIFRINKLYKPGMSKSELYDVTRCYWNVDLDKAGKCKYAMAAYQGRIVAVYEIVAWYDAGTTFSLRDMDGADGARKEFVGRECKTKRVRKRFLGKSISKLTGYDSRTEFLYYGI